MEGEGAAKEVKRALAYFTEHAERMDYPRFIALKLPIGSGAVECVCKVIIEEREKGAGMRWTPPVQVSQQAFDQRLSTLPSQLFAELFRTILPTLPERARGRTRPQTPAVARALRHFDLLWIVDATTLEELAHKIGLLREAEGKMLAGKLLAVLNLPSKLRIHLWLEDGPNVNEKSFLDRIKGALLAKTLLILDRTSARPDHPFGPISLQSLRSSRADGRDLRRRHLASLPDQRPRPDRTPGRRCCRPVRSKVADRRSLLAGQPPPGLAYLWTGSCNSIALQVWATWLLYAVLIDLSDAVAEELNLPLDQISAEMVYRGLYHFCTDQRSGQPRDPVAYLAAQPDLGIVKRRRKYRERVPLSLLRENVRFNCSGKMSAILEV